MIVSEKLEAAKRNEEGYSSCIKGVGLPNSDLTVASCGDIWFQSTNGLGWEQWFQAIAAYAIFALIIYCIAWASIWVVKWILRGRDRVT